MYHYRVLVLVSQPLLELPELGELPELDFHDDSRECFSDMPGASVVEALHTLKKLVNHFELPFPSLSPLTRLLPLPGSKLHSLLLDLLLCHPIRLAIPPPDPPTSHHLTNPPRTTWSHDHSIQCVRIVASMPPIGATVGSYKAPGTHLLAPGTHHQPSLALIALLSSASPWKRRQAAVARAAAAAAEVISSSSWQRQRLKNPIYSRPTIPYQGPLRGNNSPSKKRLRDVH